MQEIISLSLFYTTALSLAKNNFLFYFIYRVSKKKIEAFSNKIIPSHMMGDIFFLEKDTIFCGHPVLSGSLPYKNNFFTSVLYISRFPCTQKCLYPHLMYYQVPWQKKISSHFQTQPFSGEQQTPNYSDNHRNQRHHRK